jgi:hypothetical protein
LDLDVRNSTVQKLQEEPLLGVSKSMLYSNFWDFLFSWGGTWMWSNIDTNQPRQHNITWLATGMSKGTLIWVIDGSYDKKKAKDLCGVWWMILCNQTRFRLVGTF